MSKVYKVCGHDFEGATNTWEVKTLEEAAKEYYDCQGKTYTVEVYQDDKLVPECALKDFFPKFDKERKVQMLEKKVTDLAKELSAAQKELFDVKNS